MKNSKIRSVKFNFIMNFILTASNFIFPLITFPYVSRVLQASGNGKISFVSSVANYFMMVASLGIPTYGIRACAQVRDNKEKLSKTVQEIFCINLVMTIFVMVTYVICIFTIQKFYVERTLFFINGVNIVLNMFGMNWLFQALEQYDYITYRSIIFKIVSIGMMFLFVHHQGDYIIYAAITVFAAVGSNVLNFIRAHRYIKFSWMGDYDLKKHFKPIFILFAQSLAVSIYTNLDSVMLGFLKNDVDVGYYSAAVKVKGILLSLVTSLGNVLLPRMAYYAKEKLYEEFNDTMLKALNFTVLMSIPLTTYFVIYANEAINFLAGNGYAGAVLAMQIITVAVIPNGLTGVLGIQVLTAIEKEECVLYSVIIGAIVDFILNIFFIPLYGAAGAALATTIAEFSVLIVQLFYTKELLQTVKRKFRFHLYFLLSIISSLGCLLLRIVVFKSTFIILLVSAIIYFGIYAVGLIVIKEPIILDTIKNLLKKIYAR